MFEITLNGFSLSAFSTNTHKTTTKYIVLLQQRNSEKKNRFDFVRFRQNTGTIWHTADHIYLWQIKIGMNLCVKCKRIIIFVCVAFVSLLFLGIYCYGKISSGFPLSIKCPLNFWAIRDERREENKTQNKNKSHASNQIESYRIESTGIDLKFTSIVQHETAWNNLKWNAQHVFNIVCALL